MSDKCSHEWINALVCTKCGKVARSSHTYNDVVTCTEAKLAEAQTRIAELEEERVELRNALARIRDYNPPDEMSHKAWRVRINVMRNWAWKALARKGRKDGEHDCMGV